MVFAEATTVVPLLVSYAYHKKNWNEERDEKRWNDHF
jgi:deoxyhypusine synthase